MTATRTRTLEAFLRLPESKPYREYICGEVIRKPMPTRRHSVLQRFLLVVLHQFLGQTGLGEVFPEIRCIFGPTGGERALVPDLVVITTEHLTDDEYHLRPPDIAIEILSPRQSRTRLLDRTTFYLQNGVRLVWVIDPRTRTVAVLSPDAESRTLSERETIDGGAVLPGFSLAVADLFAQM